MWADSGRLIIYPSRAESWNRDEAVLYEVVVDRFLRIHDELADSRLADDEFVRQLTELRASYVQLVERAFTAANPALPVLVYDSDEPPNLLASFGNTR